MPLGHSYQAIADGLLAGRSGVCKIQGFDTSEHPSQIAGQIEKLPCPEGWNPDEFSELHRLEQLMLWCCSTALRDAGWWDQAAVPMLARVADRRQRPRDEATADDTWGRGWVVLLPGPTGGYRMRAAAEFLWRQVNVAARNSVRVGLGQRQEDFAGLGIGLDVEQRFFCCGTRGR